MRAFVGLALVALLMACGASAAPAPASRTCATDFSRAHVIDLGVADNSRSLTVPLCAAIAIELAGPPSSQWQYIQSSDDAILTIVPLPLPAPPPGGARAVYLAKRTGLAALLSKGPDLRCANPIGVCPIVRWLVTIKVVDS